MESLNLFKSKSAKKYCMRKQTFLHIAQPKRSLSLSFPSKYISCHDPSHGGFYMAEGASYIRIGLPPHVVSGDRLVLSCYGLTARYLHCRRTYPMSRDWGCTSTHVLSSYVPTFVYAALEAIPTVTCTPTFVVVCIP